MTLTTLSKILSSAELNSNGSTADDKLTRIRAMKGLTRLCALERLVRELFDEAECEAGNDADDEIETVHIVH